jgi:hypothetical protein
LCRNKSIQLRDKVEYTPLRGYIACRGQLAYQNVRDSGQEVQIGELKIWLVDTEVDKGSAANSRHDNHYTM